MNKTTLGSLRDMAASFGAGASAVLLICVLFSIGECRDWRAQKEVAKRPIHVEQTKRFQSYDTVKIPVDLNVPVVPQEDRSKLAKKYGRPDLAHQNAPGSPVSHDLNPTLGTPLILGEFKLPRLQEGGDALVTADQDGNVRVDVAPKAKPFFGFEPEWRFRAGVGVDSGGNRVGGLLVGWSAPRTGRIRYGVDGVVLLGSDTKVVGLVTVGF